MSENRGRDPYYALNAMMREVADERIPLHVCIGEVLSYSGPGKILIRADGHDLDAEDLRIADYLQCEFTEDRQLEYVGSTRFTGNATCAYGMHEWFDISGMQRPLAISTGPDPNSRRLQAGDLVLLIPDQDRQIYTVVCKVVSP